jgi:hypothetical protein
MPHNIFFSWQLDRATVTGRNFIERALERALGQLGADTEIDTAIRDELALDRDTKGVPGQPPIVETIFKKIDRAALFVPDLTFVGTRADGRPTPNPNVLIEYGWALKGLGYGRVVAIMNTAHGEPLGENMPFDMRHLRNPICYDLPDGADDATRKAVREKLTRDLITAIGDVLGSAEFHETLPKPPPPPLFPAAPSQSGEGRFRPATAPLGVQFDDFVGHGPEIHLRDGPCIWLRLMPTVGPAGDISTAKLKQLAQKNPMRLLPIVYGTSLAYLRGADGFGFYLPDGAGHTIALSVAFAFKTGEIWAIDTYVLSPVMGMQNVISPSEPELLAALERYASYLAELGFQAPYRWIVGISGVEGRGILIPTKPNQIDFFSGAKGRCLVDTVSAEGLYDPTKRQERVLLPFLSKLYEACGLDFRG